MRLVVYGRGQDCSWNKRREQLAIGKRYQIALWPGVSEEIARNRLDVIVLKDAVTDGVAVTEAAVKRH